MEGLEKVSRFQGGVISCQAAQSISGATLLGAGAGPETSRDAHSLCASKLPLKYGNNSYLKAFMGLITWRQGLMT